MKIQFSPVCKETHHKFAMGSLWKLCVQCCTSISRKCIQSLSKNLHMTLNDALFSRAKAFGCLARCWYRAALCYRRSHTSL